MMAHRRQLKTRLWSMTRVNLVTGCWEWTGTKQSDGYAQVRFERRNRIAHRVSYEYFLGPIPAGLELDHLCRVRHCINPEHLEPVSGTVNKLRGNSPLAINARKTHCASGHEFNEANTYRYVRGGRPMRACRACNAAAVRRAKARRKERTSR